MNEKIGKIKLELLKEEFIKQIKDSYTLNLSMVLLEEFENLQQENALLKDKLKDIEKILDADCCVENVYQAMCQYLNIHDFELDLEDYLKEN